MTTTPDTSGPQSLTCPICGSIFTCSHSPDCWCAGHNAPPDLLDWLSARYDSCICPTCFGRLMAQPKEEWGR